ncbi:MAG: DUF6810 family protein [Dehalococcoidia bacterium]
MRFCAPLSTNRFNVIAIVGATLLLLIVACSSDSDGGEAAAPDDDGPVIVRITDTFDVDSFINAGWKKSKEYSTETVPESNAIWYGFYQSQDVEIRFYATHADAIGPGMDSANTVVDRTPNSNLQGNALFSGDQRTGYSDFMVAGNTVILCQTLIDICEELVENIP